MPGITSNNLMLPRDAVLPTPTALRASEVLFVVLGSSRFRWRAQRAQGSWCQASRHVRCLFVADDDPPLDAASVEHDPMPWVTIKGSNPPQHCCGLGARSGSRGHRKPRGFFCTTHRARTLRAQYRFLPALEHVQASAALRTDAFRWVALVDDDAFVFVPRLLWLLSRLDSAYPLYAGDFGTSGEATDAGIPHFACGGGGSVLSVAALRRMDVGGCRERYHTRCMQSDWMIGGCARTHNVSELRALGCGTCDPRRLKEPRERASIRQRLKDDQCFFLQNAEPLARELPLGRRSGAIVHGLDASDAWSFFRKHNLSSRGA